MRRTKLKCVRPKAPFGTQEAATLAAAGINAAATITGATLGAKAAKEAAQQQANSITNSAIKNADALKRQSENSLTLQQQSQEFVKAQNEENRDIQKQIQMNLQMLAGKENETDRLEAAKIQVKNGGSLGNKQAAYLLRGSYNSTNNLPFVVTDGGGVIPMGTTQEGYSLYQLVGNDHNHYHKTKSGKNKTGVGIRFANGGVIEGEGNQNSNLGELMLVTPNDAKFISKHTLAGFNPAKSVLNGLDPNVAFAIQENIKDTNGISDDGKSDKTYRLALNGTSLNFQYPDDYMRNMLKCGGRVKAKSGRKFDLIGWNVPAPLTPRGLNNTYDAKFNFPAYNMFTLRPTQQMETEHSMPVETRNVPQTMPTEHQVPVDQAINPQSNKNVNTSNLASYLGAGINTLGNVGGALITTIGNRKAGNLLTEANEKAGNIMADAYANLKGIDINSIDKESYRAAHAMPVLRSAYVNVQPELASVERSLQRQRTAINQGSASGAAQLNRLNRAESDAYDQRSRIYGIANKMAEQIKQSNAQRLSQAASENANRDMQVNISRTKDIIDALKYNAEVKNQSILGEAGARSGILTGNARILGNINQTNAQSWANAATNSANSFAKQANANWKADRDIDNIYAGADTSTQVIGSITTNDRNRAKRLYDAFAGIDDPTINNYRRMLNNKFKFK